MPDRYTKTPNMPSLGAHHAGKVEPYQTYALSMAGTKRKLTVPADASGSTSSHTSAAQAPSKKICHNNNDNYNPEFMAHMCFGAHMQRVHAAGMASYPWHVEEDYRQDLTCMFAHAHSKGSFRRDTAARHMIPRLAGVAPRSRKEKTAIVKEFTKYYDTVQEDLLLILDILSSLRQPDFNFVTSIRNCVASLHVTLLRNTRWRNIMPYTPLPKACLPMLRNFVADPKQNNLLHDLTDHISDIEGWLNLPSLFVEFPARVTASVMDKLQQQTERSTGKAETSPLVQSDADTKLTADIQEQRIKHICLLEERITQTNLLAEQRANQINLLKAQLDQARVEQARLTNRVKTLELASADQIAQHKVKEETWATSAAELENEHRNQITQQISEINRLSAALSAEQKRSALMGADYNNRIAQLNAALRAEQERSASIEANATRLVAQETKGMNTSIGVPDRTNSTTNNSFPGTPPPSHAISGKLTDARANSQLHLLHRVETPVIYENFRVAKECVDDCMEESGDDGEMDIDMPSKTGFGRVSYPNLLPEEQLNRFENNTTNGVVPQPHPGQDKVFKEACRNFKLGRCRHGKKCRFPHKACSHWLSGDCKHGDKCYRSHDPFFLEESTNQPLSNRSLTPIPEAHAYKSQSDESLLNQLAAQVDSGQGLNPSGQQKKQACRSHLSNVCNEGQGCQYAHMPCSYFISGTCKFTDQTCKKSHDPLFITQGGVSGDRSQSTPSQQTKIPDLQSNLYYLDQIIQAAGKTINKSGPVSISVPVCKWQKDPAGCTNARCRYRHDF